jgi:two-component system CheB/CheR fusion protein
LSEPPDLLDRDLQSQACSTFHYALKPKGFLFLGSSESADQPSGLFRPVDREARIFQSVQQSPDRRTAPPTLVAGHFSRGVPSLQPRTSLSPNTMVDASVHRQMLEKIAPTSIVVDEAHRAVHLSQNARAFPAAIRGSGDHRCH